MTCFKVVLVFVSIGATIVHCESESDEVALLQSVVEEKSGQKTKASIDFDDEIQDKYDLAEALNCASEKKDVPQLPESLIEPITLPKENASVALDDASDPPGAHALRAVFQLMIISLVFDGMRRWRLQKKEACKGSDSEAAEEAAWVDMVNAAAKGDTILFEKALSKKPSTTQADTWGCTPLHFAAVGGSEDITKQLLKQGVDVDALDASEETPLHFAARAGHATICELLLEAGAKLDPVNVRCMTPFVVAGHANADAACRLLADRGAGVAGLADEDLPPLVVSQVIRKVFAAGQ